MRSLRRPCRVLNGFNTLCCAVLLEIEGLMVISMTVLGSIRLLMLSNKWLTKSHDRPWKKVSRSSEAITHCEVGLLSCTSRTWSKGSAKIFTEHAECSHAPVNSPWTDFRPMALATALTSKFQPMMWTKRFSSYRTILPS